MPTRQRILAAIAASTVIAFLLVTGCVYKWDSQEDWVDLFAGGPDSGCAPENVKS